MSASTKAPAYKDNYFVTGSATIAAVKPTPELPLPVVYTARGDTYEICFNNCDFAIPGSPNKAIFIYPLILRLSTVLTITPPAI